MHRPRDDIITIRSLLNDVATIVLPQPVVRPAGDYYFRPTHNNNGR